MSYTTTFQVNAIADPESVIANTYCRSIRIREDPSVPGYPTVGFKVRAPAITSAPIQLVAGESFSFTRSDREAIFAPGDVVGYVETLVGSTTFSQDEER